MSTVKAKNIKVPNSAGTAEATLSFDGVSVVSDKPVVAQGGSLTLMTAKTATGTSVDFTGIPSWAKRVTVMLDGISTTGANVIFIQVGSGSIQTTGYTSQAWAGTNNAGVLTTGIAIEQSNASAYRISGHTVITKVNTNRYVSAGVHGYIDITSVGHQSAGSVTTSGDIDRIRITTAGGTDTFDAGTINVMYEG